VRAGDVISRHGAGSAPRYQHRQLVVAQSAIPPVVRLASLLSVVICISNVSDTLRDFNYYFVYTSAYST
jgi:hypothetical protein